MKEERPSHRDATRLEEEEERGAREGQVYVLFTVDAQSVGPTLKVVTVPLQLIA